MSQWATYLALHHSLTPTHPHPSLLPSSSIDLRATDRWSLSTHPLSHLSPSVTGGNVWEERGESEGVVAWAGS